MTRAQPAVGGAKRGKQLRNQAFIGQAGINMIERRVLEMRCAWHPAAAHFDAGIDGTIELRDPATQEALNVIVQVQSKATQESFTAETEHSFTYLCDERDLDYWIQGNTPVILVVSRPHTDEAYWVPIKEYFRDPIRRRKRQVEFNKQRDRFAGEVTRLALMELAVSPDVGLYTTSAPIPEQLYSNLLAITALPPRLYLAEALLRREGLVAAARERGLPDEWAFKSPRILSVYDLSEPTWAALVDRGTVEEFETWEWAETDDEDRRRDFVALLNRCLSARCRQLDLRWQRDLKFYYFAATEDLRPRVVRYQNRIRESERTVVQNYATKKTDQDARTYYRHAAFQHRFRRYANRWHLELTPTYHFTSDGRRPLKFYESKLKGIKALEKNPTVLGQVIMLAALLRGPSEVPTAPAARGIVEDLFEVSTPTAQPTLPPAAPPYPYLQFGELVTFDLPVGINDAAWLPSEEPDEARVITTGIEDLPMWQGISGAVDGSTVTSVLEDQDKMTDGKRANTGPTGVTSKAGAGTRHRTATRRRPKGST